ncbi:MAG: rhodanese-like domain-containing protein [Bacteroidetes bacterium]|nr:rhodanese-like domain-containing protein [Bacteroidota bacterium]
MTASIRIFAIALFILATLSSGVQAKNQKTKDIRARAFKRQIAKEQVILVDARTPDEYNTSHLENAKMIDFKADDFKEKITKLPKNKTICVYCRSGNRSAQTMEILKQEGYLRVYNLKGGITAWQEKRLKTVN